MIRTAKQERQYFEELLKDDLAVWAPSEVERAIELGVVDTLTSALLPVCSELAPPLGCPEVDEKEKYREMLEDCLVIWRPWEVERAQELGLVDAEKAKTLAVWDDSEFFV